MPSDATLRFMNTAHRFLLKASFGKIGWKAGNMPVLELTTIGRKSGQPRSVMLTSPLQQGDTVVIVASKGGEDTHPAWYLNLRDEPNVEVAMGGGAKAPYLAKVASSEERAEMWPTITESYKGYAGYQEKTDREIPLVLLSPRP
jgi:deazaflavin-dependent oxidoreductase (nitroreductase family)